MSTTSPSQAPITDFHNVLTLSSRKYWDTTVHDAEGRPLYWIEEPGSRTLQFSHDPIHIYRRSTPGSLSSEDDDAMLIHREEVATINFCRFRDSKVVYHGKELLLNELMRKKQYFGSAHISSTPIGDVEWSLKLYSPELHGISGTKLLTSANVALVSTGTPQIEVSNLIDIFNPEVMDLLVVGWVTMMHQAEKKRRRIISTGAIAGS
ncbi:hypothetical protein DL93DRAFT_2078945 [Clavulina sp. PMI_390]|nr:hypothetical protein DL93DRAFT_2078945 [Clavulina sp. PMI_390]